jgi:hypothetical protein
MQRLRGSKGRIGAYVYWSLEMNITKDGETRRYFLESTFA